MLISVVIITKNEAHIIGNTLQSLYGLADDIVIVDSGSTDETISICKQFNAHIIQTTWDGYGNNKNKGIDAAVHNWILNIDADEAIDEVLKQTLLDMQLQNENEVFEIKFKNFFCGKLIRFGEWGFDKHIRLFNRKKVRWNAAAVHESLQLPDDVRQGKKINWLKQYLSPVFSFIQNYFFKLGFLDGREGFIIAKATAKYTRLKYKYLAVMQASKISITQ
jgi:glycosyltransferase involved in cell wall biosynthesis